MRATRFFIRRYRAFDKEVEVKLGGLTVVTGANNLGKSTVLLGLRLFFWAISGPTTYPRLYRFEADYPKRYEGKPGRRVNSRISVEFAISDSEIGEIEAVTGHRFPPCVIVHIEFPPKAYRVVIGTEPEAPENARTMLCARISERVRYVYIPASRGLSPQRPRESYRSEVQGEISRLAFSKVRNTRQRLKAFEKLIADATSELTRLQAELAGELQRYMPDLQSIEFQINAPEIRSLMRLDDIILNDGATTPLSQKGDGIKNLFAIAVLQYIARQDPGDHLILGIEEPEAHLHASAVYKLKPELRELGNKHQVIITTHSPILIQRDEIANNLIVGVVPGEDFVSTVQPARTLAEIRSCLGIKPQDNMSTAEVVIVVEGETEVAICSKLLGGQSAVLSSAIDAGRVRVLSANGASKVSSVIRALARDAASCVVLLDSDDEGRSAREDLVRSGLISPRDIFLVPDREGCKETEFEDMFDPALYCEELNIVCGTDMTIADIEEARRKSGSRGNRAGKWSEMFEKALAARGKMWQDLRTEVRKAFAAAILGKAEKIDLGQFPSLKDMATRATSMLREEDEQRVALSAALGTQARVGVVR